MMWGISAVVLLVWFYIFFGREMLVTKWPERFSWWHSIEDSLWQRSRTLLVARIYWVGGILLFIHDSLAMSSLVDWEPIIGQFAGMFPEKYRALVATIWPVATGILFEALRWMTTQPVQEQKAEAEMRDSIAIADATPVEANPAVRSEPDAG